MMDAANGFVLLALDGAIVGHVVKAHVASREDGGYVIVRVDDESGQVAMREGDVAYLGDIRQDPALIARRMSEVRIRLGIPYYAGAEPPPPEVERALCASQLEDLAMQIRHGEVTVANITQTNQHDSLPLPAGHPEGDWRNHPTGRMSYLVDYTHKDAVEAHARVVKQWAEEHPDLVPQYVRNQREG